VSETINLYKQNCTVKKVTRNRRSQSVIIPRPLFFLTTFTYTQSWPNKFSKCNAIYRRFRRTCWLCHTDVRLLHAVMRRNTFIRRNLRRVGEPGALSRHWNNPKFVACKIGFYTLKHFSENYPQFRYAPSKSSPAFFQAEKTLQ
jgi:hypothetical protein